MARGLDWHITGLWHPDATTVPYYGRVADPGAGEVKRIRGGSRTADVTVSMFDPIVHHIVGKPYARFLKVYNRDDLVFWGPAKLLIGDMAAGTLRISAICPSLRMIYHQLRRGDLADAPIELNAGNDDKGAVTVDHIGLRILRDAALNTAGQTARGVPDLGVIDGSNTFPADPDSRMGVTRGDQVWNTILQLSESLGPDFDLEPIEDTIGAYAQLNTYAAGPPHPPGWIGSALPQGTDRRGTVAFHFGMGHQNLENVQFSDGTRYITHAHVLSRDLEYRFTASNPEASAETGPYVQWDATDFDAHDIDPAVVEDVLIAYGVDIIKAYSRPLIELDLTLPIEDASDLWVGRDYDLGDLVGVAGRQGYVELEEAAYRINAITLQQASADNAVRPVLGVVADRVDAAGDSIDGEE